MKRTLSLVVLVATAAFGEPTHDAAFADKLARHHQDGIRIAQLAVDRAMNPELRDMARRMVLAQQREIEILASLRGDAPVIARRDDELLSESDWARLEAARGPAFDVAFTEIMARHRRSGVALAKRHADTLSNPALRELARQTASTQDNERARLRAVRENPTASSEQLMISSSAATSETERRRMRKD